VKGGGCDPNWRKAECGQWTTDVRKKIEEIDIAVLWSNSEHCGTSEAEGDTTDGSKRIVHLCLIWRRGGFPLAKRSLFEKMIETNRAVLSTSEEEVAMERRELDGVDWSDVTVVLEGVSLTTERWIGYDTSPLLETRGREGGWGSTQWEERRTDDSLVALRILDACVRTIDPPSCVAMSHCGRRELSPYEKEKEVPPWEGG
jgi:hypothetical protein